MKLLKFLVFLSMLPIVVFGQSNDKEKIKNLFGDCQAIYEKTGTYSFNCDYKMYSDYNSSKLVENYKGILVKKRNESYMKIHKTEFLQKERLTLKIDNESRVMKVTEKKVLEQAKIYDLKGFLSYFDHFSLVSKGENWICTLLAPKLTFVPYSKIVVSINKKTKRLVKQELYLLKAIPQKDIKGNIVESYPRLDITLGDFQTKNIPTAVFDVGNYVVFKNKKYSASLKYKNYKIVD